MIKIALSCLMSLKNRWWVCPCVACIGILSLKFCGLNFWIDCFTFNNSVDWIFFNQYMHPTFTHNWGIEKDWGHFGANNNKGIMSIFLEAVFILCTTFPHTNYLPFSLVSPKHTHTHNAHAIRLHTAKRKGRNFKVNLHLFVWSHTPNSALKTICK